MQLRVRAIETVLAEKGYIDSAALDVDDRGLRDQDRPAQWRPRRRQGVDRSGIQAGADRGCDQGGAVARLDRSRRRSPDCGREHTEAPQHDRLHAVLLLSLGSARPAAGLVQIRALSIARGQRSARRAGRFRSHASGGHPNPGLGLDRGDALHRAADAAGRHRRLERGKARRAGNPRLHGRHRLAARSRRISRDGRHSRHGRHARLRQSRAGERTSRFSTPPGKDARSRCSAP